jgi:predicted transposase/invertase (TIGR01784 family)
MKRNDILWKNIIEDIFDDFLRFFFAGSEQIFASEKGFDFLDTELGQLLDNNPSQLFPTEDIQAPKHIDKLVKVFTGEGEDEYMMLHIEVQGYKDDNFEERMHTYFYRIKDKYKKPVAAIAILTDPGKKYRPAAYKYDYIRTSVAYRFNVYKVMDQQEAELLKNDNPFAVVILTVLLALKQKKLDDSELYNQKLELARNLLSRKIPAEKTKRLLRFLKYYVRFDKKENIANFDNAIQELTNKKGIMGIEEYLIEQAEKEGIRKGIKKGQGKKSREFVKILLLNTDFTVAKIARLVNVTESFVRKMKKSATA